MLYNDEETKIRKQLLAKEERKKIVNYKKTMRIYLMTSRFNTTTRKQNEIYRNQKWPQGCIYCAPEPISEKIPFNSKMIILEMDNDTNKIFAVGMCVNKSFINKYNVYSDGNYNRYTYIGKHRITREELQTKEECAIFDALDILCFKGNDHMKRGHGIKSFPVKMLLRCHTIVDIPAFIENMFKTRFNNV